MPRKIRFVGQDEQSECGLACLVMVANALGHNLDMLSARLVHQPSPRGTTLAQLMAAASALNLIARPVRVEIKALERLELPAILHWEFNHFVVLERASRTEAIILDPGQGRRRISLEEFSRYFTGVALELRRDKNFQPQHARRALSFRTLIGDLSSVRVDSLLLILCIALIETMAILSPIVISAIIDRSGSGMSSALLTLAFAFVVLIAAGSTLSVTRSALVSRLTTKLFVPASDAAFRHLLKLPLRYFESRAGADIASRFDSLSLIHKGATARLIESLLDGGLAFVMIAAIFMLHPPAGGLLLACILAVAATQVLIAPRVMERTVESINRSAQQAVLFFDGLRGVQTIKVFGLEQLKATRLLNAVIQTANSRAREQLAISILAVTQRALLTLGLLLVIVAVATAESAEQWTTGFILLVVTYATQAIFRVERCFGVIEELRNLTAHKDRVADILLAEAEPVDDSPVMQLQDVEVEVRSLSFRHSPEDQWILNNVSFKIAAGESVVITGPSGCGKSTLLKLLLGLYPPTSGEILINGRPLSRMRAGLRPVTASVLQEDRLFAGSIAQNISLFCSNARMDLIEEAAALAGIREEIERMPMRYHTLVSQATAGLSSGQLQRILLARAFYCKPRLLVLDEATSHLDIDNEAAIARRLQDLNVTRIVVAHRPETIRLSGREISLRQNQITV